eukprot:3851405-Ditylum_brightwellii.AAC.1
MDAQLDIHWSDEDGWTQLHFAAYDGERDTAEKLLSLGADTDKQANGGWTPLFLAAQEGHQEVAALLLSNGADINRCDDDGVTPLTVAITLKHDGVESILRAAGASMPTDKMDLKTVDDVLSFLKDIKLQQEYLPQIEESIFSN